MDKISKIARNRKKITVVDLFNNFERERTKRQSILSNTPGPISKRKYVPLRNLKNK